MLALNRGSLRGADAPARPAADTPCRSGAHRRRDLLPHFALVPLEKEDYVSALDLMASGGWVGAKIYDLLLLHCAARCAVERIYTFNLADFRQLAPPGLQEKICSP